jgi:hypothetical protein
MLVLWHEGPNINYLFRIYMLPHTVDNRIRPAPASTVVNGAAHDNNVIKSRCGKCGCCKLSTLSARYCHKTKNIFIAEVLETLMFYYETVNTLIILNFVT